MQPACKLCQRCVHDKITGTDWCLVQTARGVDPSAFKNAVAFWMGKVPTCFSFKGKPEKTNLVKEVT